MVAKALGISNPDGKMLPKDVLEKAKNMMKDVDAGEGLPKVQLLVLAKVLEERRVLKETAKAEKDAAKKAKKDAEVAAKMAAKDAAKAAKAEKDASELAASAAERAENKEPEPEGAESASVRNAKRKSSRKEKVCRAPQRPPRALAPSRTQAHPRLCT